MSTVTRAARRLQFQVGRLLVVVVVLLVANSLFLYTERLPDGVVANMLRAHVWLGYALSVLMPAFFIPHLITHWRHPNRRARWIGYSLLTAIVVGCVCGLTLAARGRGADTAMILRIHEASFAVALAAYMAHRLSAYVTPVLRYELVGLTVSLTLMASIWTVQYRQRAIPIRATDEPVPVEMASFGASRAQTVDGHYLEDDDLRNPDYCAQCHVEIAEQWNGSLHRFSSQNDPFYQKTLAVMMRHSQPTAFQFCGGCHDPLVLMTGNMNQPIGPDSVNAQEGITCLTCHGVIEVRDRIGNAGYTLAPPDHYPFYGSDDPDEQETNRRLIRTKPEKHKANFLKPLHRTAEFCLTCHKTHLDEQVNNYRWKRGPNDFDAWHDSAAGQQSALTFYDSKGLQRCQDCHMPDVPTNDPAARDGLSRDHTFPAANTAMAMLKDKPDWFKKTEEILRECCTVDILAAAPIESDGSAGKRVFALDQSQWTVVPGQTVRIDVVVRNRKVGHAFPTGTTDLNEPWLQFEVADETGEPILGSGMLDNTGRLDPSAHKFVTVLLTREGRFVDIHNVEEFYTALYANLIPLGQSDVVRYEFVVPERPMGSRLTLTSRLNYRKFSRQYTEFALGVDAPQLPVTLIDEDQVELVIGSEFQSQPPTADETLAYRLNDFGIAHLRQGDTLTAVRAFEMVAEMMPDYADAWINVARCYLQDGAYDQLEEVLRKADTIRPGHTKTAYFLGRLRAAQGRFDEAVTAYDVTLAAFPDDREVLNAKGTSLYKLERFVEAIEVFKETLRVDPENLTANTLLFRCYSSIDDMDQAKMYEARYLKYRTEERERSATELYRRNNPYADAEANVQHVHHLTPLPAKFNHPDEYRPSFVALPTDGQPAVPMIKPAQPTEHVDPAAIPDVSDTGPYGAPLR